MFNQQPLLFEPHWADYLMQMVYSSNVDVRTAIARAKKTIPNLDRFATELSTHFYCYQGDHVALPEEEIKNEAKWAVPVLDSVLTLPEYWDLKAKCEGDRLASTLAMEQFVSEFVARLPQPEEKLVDLEELRDKIRGINQREQMLKSQGEELDEFYQQLRQELKQKGVEAAQSYLNYAEQLESQGSKLAQALASSINSASDVVDQLQSVQHTFGWDDSEGSDGSSGNIEEKLKLVKAVLQNNKLRKIFEQAGRMLKQFVDKRRSRSTSGYSIHNLELGDDLSKLVPAEIGNLAIPQLRPLFAAKYADKQLLQHKTRGKDKSTKGPIVVCIDSSGSMDGLREIWAKGVMAAIYALAERQKRHLRVVHFSSSVCRIDDFPAKDKTNRSKLLASLDYFNGGGTNWQRPLDKAVEIITKQSVMRKSDIVFITDGACRVDDDWLSKFNKTKSRCGFSTYGVMIGGYSSDAFDNIADSIVQIENLNDDGGIKTVFEI